MNKLNRVAFSLLILSASYFTLHSQSKEQVDHYGERIVNLLKEKCSDGSKSTDVTFQVAEAWESKGSLVIPMAVTWSDYVGAFDWNSKTYAGYAVVDMEYNEGFFVIAEKEEQGTIFNSCYESLSAEHKSTLKENLKIEKGNKFVFFERI